ncbi:hypothetical protein KC973_01405 [Candidatus Saccharibacteria bacterium]|nr:hypothetical protein [Candidatus Saccharibacteria bacterium]
MYGLRGKNPTTLSYHAIATRASQIVYLIVHLILGVLLWLIMTRNFGIAANDSVLYVLTLTAVFSEWGQAVVPAKGRSDVAHTILATIMALSMTLVPVFLVFRLSASFVVELMISISTILVLSLFIFVRYPPRPGTWKLQLLGQLALYTQMFILIQLV